MSVVFHSAKFSEGFLPQTLSLVLIIFNSFFFLSYDTGHAQLRSTDTVVVAEGATLLADDHRVQ